MNIDPAAGTFVADARRLRQILFNLLSNAIAVTPEGGTVTLGAMRREGALVFTVRDEGPGVPAEVRRPCSTGSRVAAPARAIAGWASASPSCAPS